MQRMAQVSGPYEDICYLRDILYSVQFDCRLCRNHLDTNNTNNRYVR